MRDIWTSKDDIFLAETVLKHVRDGSTQLLAFEEVGIKLERTAAACGFRWNKEVRHEFKQAFQNAKKIRLERKRNPITKMSVVNEVNSKITEVVRKVVNINDLEVKVFKRDRVVTFKDIDEVHGRTEGTAKRNFSQNKKHMIEGEDFYQITRNEFRTEFGFGSNAPTGILLTESGYLMLVKSFTDDLSWKVQRKLVKTYFRVKEVMNQQIHSYMIMDPVERAKVWIKEQEEKQKIETEKLMLEQTVAEYQPKMSYLDTILESKDSVIVSQISEDYGLSAKALNKILHEEGVQYKRNEQWLLYSEHKGLGYTESRTIPFLKPNGDKGTTLQTRWTQKGRLFIHNVLSNKGIKPLMDR